MTKNQNLSEPLWVSSTGNQLSNRASTRQFVVSKQMNTMFFADGNQLRYASLTCNGLYKTCDYIPARDPLGCAWCAETDGSGYSYPVSASNSSDARCRTKQPLPIGDCPPHIGDVIAIMDPLQL